MHKIQQAQEILKSFGLPPAQYNETAALTLLALCQVKEDDDWVDAANPSLGVSKGIMKFISDNYGKTYAANSRETFRRQVLHQFVQARIADLNPDNPTLPVNSPKAHYGLTHEALTVIGSFGSEDWEDLLKKFADSFGRLTETYLKERKLNLIPVTLPNGSTLTLSAGKHNEVQAAIVEQFAPRFANNGMLLYLGDTAKKDLYVEFDKLKDLGIPIDQHSKLPDVIIYDQERNWLFLIEAVTSHGPVSPKRMHELEDLFKNCPIGKVYVTAFPDMTEFKKHSKEIAWETEVWLMDIPDHMIHFNGDRFMGPRS
ncbi:BsuBI/PstI family type II restriction endonuclease [Pedobacter sp. BMA]|uniref:BsuBI/PstI family type II restriction endonuclease n=1 Tax=Pedobacter sp. BMA TaxID=1663685 RepID=UPI00064B18C5|nr:BsuBI/PstI family type II restriction endonuclease [Pedobacter sp. BMA]KLT66464.1 restriction endonuclease BsuBI [Pedobacter sp. BMA]